MPGLQHAHQPGENERQQREGAGGKQAQRADERAAEVMDEDQAHEEERHRRQEGEDGAHATRHECKAMAADADAAAAACTSGIRVPAPRPRYSRALLRFERQPQRRSHCDVVWKVLHPALRHRCAMPTHGAAEPPPAALSGVHRLQTLLAEGVRAAQQLGHALVQVEVVVADLAFAFLRRARVARGAVRPSRLGLFRHVGSLDCTDMSDTILLRFFLTLLASSS